MMDPTTLIITALAIGAATGASVVANEAVKDAYNNLKTLVQRKSAGKPEAEMALKHYEERPKVWESPLKNALTETGVDRDEQIVQIARALVQQAIESSATMVSGSGAAATHGGAAATTGGIVVIGDIKGGIHTGGQTSSD